MKKVFWMMAVMLAVSIAVNFLRCGGGKPEIVVKCDTIWKDSIIREPLPAETIRTDRVVYIKVPVPQSDTVHDSIEVPIPIVQKRYEDSLYTAWVSGYEPKLDSIDLRLPTIKETVTITKTKPTQLVNFGVQIGGGYGVIHRQPDFYIGVGAQLNLWRK